VGVKEKKKRKSEGEMRAAKSNEAKTMRGKDKKTEPPPKAVDGKTRNRTKGKGLCALGGSGETAG